MIEDIDSCPSYQNVGVRDWPSVVDVYPTYASYSSYVSLALIPLCTSLKLEGVSKHGSQIPYSAVQPCLTDVLSSCRDASLSWLSQLQLRGWCRVRAGLACLVGGRRSATDIGSAIFVAVVSVTPPNIALQLVARGSQPGIRTHARSHKATTF